MPLVDLLLELLTSFKFDNWVTIAAAALYPIIISQSVPERTTRQEANI
jgi:hypothetical protein